MAIARSVWCVVLFLVGTALFFHFRWSSTSSTHLHLESVNNACLEKVKNLTDNWKKENGKEAIALTTLAKTPQPVDPPPPIPLEDAFYKEDRPQAFHLFWEDVAPVARGCPCRACSHKLAVLIRSWLATQDTARSSLTIWATNTSFLSTDPLLTPLLPFINIRAYKSHEQAQGTVLEGSPVLDYTDERAYLQSDLARILILYRHGGTYVDTDSIFLNDFTPLWDHEFVARWACTPGIAVGVLHFEKGSEFALDLMKAIAATASNPERGGYDWGRELYTRVYAMRQQRAATYPQQQPLPYNYEACYFYPEWCTEGFHDYAMTPDPDEPERPLFLETFTYHWHGAGGMRYNKPIEAGSQFERTSHLVDRALMLKFGAAAAIPLISNHGFDPAAPIPWCWPYIWKRLTKFVLIPIGFIITILAIIHWLKPTFIPRMITIIHTRIITPTITWCMGKRRIHAYSAVPNRSDV